MTMIYIQSNKCKLIISSSYKKLTDYKKPGNKIINRRLILLL